jgi:hypothetical protein
MLCAPAMLTVWLLAFELLTYAVYRQACRLRVMRRLSAWI